MIYIGQALCGNCGKEVTTILTGKTEPAEDGGLFWECEPNQSCGHCGASLIRLHSAPLTHPLFSKVSVNDLHPTHL